MEPGSRIPIRSAGLIERDIGDAVVVMAYTGKVLHTLQGTALFIWRLIDGINPVDFIENKLLAEYKVKKTQAATDLDSYLCSLSEKKLIHFQ